MARASDEKRNVKNRTEKNVESKEKSFEIGIEKRVKHTLILKIVQIAKENAKTTHTHTYTNCFKTCFLDLCHKFNMGYCL